MSHSPTRCACANTVKPTKPAFIVKNVHYFTKAYEKNLNYTVTVILKSFMFLQDLTPSLPPPLAPPPLPQKMFLSFILSLSTD